MTFYNGELNLALSERRIPAFSGVYYGRKYYWLYMRINDFRLVLLVFADKKRHSQTDQQNVPVCADYRDTVLFL